MQPGRGDDIRGRVRRLFAFFGTEIARLHTLGNAPAARDHRHQEIVQQLLRDVLREGDPKALRITGAVGGCTVYISGHKIYGEEVSARWTIWNEGQMSGGMSIRG